MDRPSPSPVMTQTDRSGRDGLQARGHGRGAAVDRVDAVGVHVVRKAAGAADAGDEHDLLARDAEGRQHLLHLGEDRVVAAAGAPADVLVAGEVVGGEFGFGGEFRWTWLYAEGRTVLIYRAAIVVQRQ